MKIIYSLCLLISQNCFKTNIDLLIFKFPDDWFLFYNTVFVSRFNPSNLFRMRFERADELIWLETLFYVTCRDISLYILVILAFTYILCYKMKTIIPKYSLYSCFDIICLVYLSELINFLLRLRTPRHYRMILTFTLTFTSGW